MDKLKSIVARLTGTIIGGLLIAMTISIPALAVGWAYDNAGWWYDMGNNSYPANSWLFVDGYWYFFNSSGYMATGWVESSGYWYYCDLGSGVMVTGWRQIDGIWYWFDENGAMATGWRSINGDWYYFEPDGSMAYDCYIDGGWINSNGVWHEDKNTYVENDGSDYQEKAYSDFDDTVYETEEIYYENKNDIDDSVQASQNSNNNNIENNIANNDLNVSQAQTVASTLSITDWIEVEDEYEMGITVPITGIITSNYDITYVKLIYHPEYMFTEDYEREFTPNSKVFDLSKIDLSDFDTAKINNTLYSNRFELEARDASGKKIEVKTDYFKIVVTQKTVIDQSDFIEPDDEMTEGTDYKIQGVIRSNYPFTKVSFMLRSKKDGDVIAESIFYPYSKEVDLGKELGAIVDFSKLDAEPYQFLISVDSGEKNIYYIINKRIEIKEAPKTILYAINDVFYDTEEGHKVISGYKSFSERILKDAEERIAYGYRSTRPYVLFSSKNEDTEGLKINCVYAHSFGQVIEADEEGVITIRHENGMKTRYSNLDPKQFHVKKGTWVDENTIIGEITKNNPKRLKVELFDKNEEAMDITSYLNSDLPG